MVLKKIFFSYSRVDGADFALRLAQDLKNAGFNVWIDQQDIRAGTEWDLEIEKALETCDCLLFIESEKSVVSNNVLDEVYYAIEQQKKVIPIIYHDSKTPYRLQRLQHVDFSKSYNEGLAYLISELRGNFQSRPGSAKKDSPEVIAQPWYAKYARYIAGGTVVVIIAVAIIFLFKKDPAKKIAGYQVTQAETDGDTSANTTDRNVSQEDIARTTRAAKKRSVPEQRKGGENVSGNISGKIENLEGDWKLISVDPKAASQNGYLKIETAGADKIDIKTSLQFYYYKTNDTSYLSVFNGIAGCAGCPLQREMKLKTEDIAVGSQTYKILKRDQPGRGKAGDTVMNAGANKSIPGKMLMRFIDKNTAVITVTSSKQVSLSYGLVIEPFVYSFRFEKID